MMHDGGMIGILAFVPDLWSDCWQPRHHILCGLAEHYKVLWVSPPTYWETLRTGRGQSLTDGRGLKKVSNSLWAYAPIIPANYKWDYGTRVLGGWRRVSSGFFRHYHSVWQRAHTMQIRRLLRRMGIEKVILYVWRPEYHWALDRFKASLTCYHIDDDYGFDPTGDAPISKEEMKLLKQSDFVFIHSKTLMEKKGSINPNTYAIPNGVDFELFRSAMESDDPEPDDLAAIPHPRIGYVGYIKRHLDLGLLIEIARRRRDWSIVLVGPVREGHREIAEDVAQLRREPNVHFLGSKPYEVIPYYIKGFDVCLMPYKVTSYTKYIYPMKLHEYLACGKPVVSTPLENLGEFAHVLDFADSPEEWIESIEQSLLRTDTQLSIDRVAIAKNNSWTSRVDSVKSHMKFHLRKRQLESVT